MSASGANQTLPDSKQQRFVLLQIVLLQIIKNGVAHGATKPGKELLGLRRRWRLAFPGCIN
jgi:hypothetical protein